MCVYTFVYGLHNFYDDVPLKTELFYRTTRPYNSEERTVRSHSRETVEFHMSREILIFTWRKL
jgi:hypothetical protein